MKYNFNSVSVIGIARSGVASALFLKNKGYDVFISDAKDFSDDNNFISILKQNNIDFETGKHSYNRIADSDLIVISPGVPLYIDLLKKLKKLNKIIIGEIELAFSFMHPEAKVVAITGTNGKSTTTALTGEIFKNAGFKTVVAGNIGFPLISFIDSIDADTVVVLELSSFQLETIKHFKPYVSIITNITPDHMDRYSSFEDYANAKFNIFMNQNNDSFLVINKSVDFNVDIVLNKNINVVFLQDNSFKTNFVNMFDKDKITYFINGCYNEIIFDNIFLLGQHNYENIASSSAVALIFNITADIIKNTVQNFKGLNHRLEFVREVNDVKFYNDSKATNPESALKAILSFDKNIILILGGRPKGSGFSILAEAIKNRVKFFILIGEAKDLIIQELNLIKNYAKFDSLDEAVFFAFNKSKKDDIVLFSPACTSFDMFNDFEHRGNIFKELVLKL